LEWYQHGLREGWFVIWNSHERFTDKWTTAAAREALKLIDDAVETVQIADESARKESSDYGHGHDAACDALAAKIPCAALPE
jgi:hypothetical protein